jgi:hypothetical protein
VNTAERRGGIEMHLLFLGLVGQLLDRISAGRKPQPPELAQHDAYRPASEVVPDQ